MVLMISAKHKRITGAGSWGPDIGWIVSTLCGTVQLIDWLSSCFGVLSVFNLLSSLVPRPVKLWPSTIISLGTFDRSNYCDHRIHRIHRRQHASEDDAGISKHRLSPYRPRPNAYYHNWLTLNFTASDSSSHERCFLKVLIVLQLTYWQIANSDYQ